MPQDIPAVETRGLSKTYHVYRRPLPLLLDRLQGRARRGRPVWALRDLDVRIAPGEFVGLVGRNGAGKSTFLQLLAGVVQPTAGTVAVRGRVLALLELGASFDPESTGRENARVQLALLRIPPSEWPRRLADIEAFAELGASFDDAVKTYSSGMYVRLAFAVNTVLEPDVLLVDEALAVGDVFFQQKCFAQIARLRERGTAIILVAHDLNLVQQWCDRVLVFADGRLVADDKPYEAVHAYLGAGALPPLDLEPEAASLTGGVPAPSQRTVHEPLAWQDPKGLALDGYRLAKLLRYQVCDPTGRPTLEVVQGQDLVVHFEFAADGPLARPVPGLEVRNVAGVVVHGKQTTQLGVGGPDRLDAGEVLAGHFRLRADLAAGPYTLALGLETGTPPTVVTAYRSRHAIAGAVLPAPARHAGPRFHGVADLPGDAWMTTRPA